MVYGLEIVGWGGVPHGITISPRIIAVPKGQHVKLAQFSGPREKTYRPDSNTVNGASFWPDGPASAESCWPEWKVDFKHWSRSGNLPQTPNSQEN